MKLWHFGRKHNAKTCAHRNMVERRWITQNQECVTHNHCPDCGFCEHYTEAGDPTTWITYKER